MPRQLTLLLGGVRSGKSRYAESWAQDRAGTVLYVATAEALDDEMRARIAEHKARRPDCWHTLEAARHVPRRVAAWSAPYDTLLLDCVTLLTSNLLLDLPEATSPAAAESAILSEIDDLLALYERSNASWLLVSNEVGMGVVPPHRSGRIYRDMLGRANQRIAERADAVLLLVAGIAVAAEVRGLNVGEEVGVDRHALGDDFLSLSRLVRVLQLVHQLVRHQSRSISGASFRHESFFANGRWSANCLL